MLETRAVVTLCIDAVAQPAGLAQTRAALSAQTLAEFKAIILVDAETQTSAEDPSDQEDARFVYLYRDARQNIASLIEAWTLGLQTGRFVTFRQLPGWDRPAWCFLLPPGWRSLVGKSLPEIAAFQWAETNRIVLSDLQALGRERWCPISYSDLVADPGATLERLCQFSGVEAPPVPGGGRLPLSRTTLTPPDPDKWKKHAAALESLGPVLDETEAMIARAVSAD